MKDKPVSQMSTEEMLKTLGITMEELREFNKSLNNGVWEQMAGYALSRETTTTNNKKSNKQTDAENNKIEK